LIDKDSVVIGGYEDLLEAVSRKHSYIVFRFIVKNKKEIALTAVKYAIELLPNELKTEFIDYS